MYSPTGRLHKILYTIIEDFRVEGRKRHNLVDVLMIVFFGLLCGYRSIEEIHFYAELSEELLKKYLELPNGIPSSDTILRILARLNPARLGKVFIEYAKEAFAEKLPKDGIVAIDGKTECGSEYAPKDESKTGHKSVHMVSAWASEIGVCFGQVKTEEKSNEITAIPELLELLDLKGIIVTIDAMGCQKAITKKITEKKSNYVISLKGNQEKIHESVRDFYTSNELDERYCERYGIQKYECELEIAHGRIEKRTYYLCTNLKWLEERNEWSNLKAVGMVRCKRIVKKTGAESNENRFFISSITDIKKAATATRKHWGIENGLHWVLDNIFDEDFSTLRKDNSAQNLNIMRKFALNALKQVDFSEFTKKKNLTIANKQHLCDKREACLEKVLSFF